MAMKFGRRPQITDAFKNKPGPGAQIPKQKPGPIDGNPTQVSQPVPQNKYAKLDAFLNKLGTSRTGKPTMLGG